VDAADFADLAWGFGHIAKSVYGVRRVCRFVRMSKISVVLSVVLMTFAARSVAAQGPSEGASSRLPVPRFASLKADKVNMHVGPAKDFEVKWRYQRAGLPVEITGEYENWRRIRDSEGTEGWVYHSLLSGRRTGVVTLRAKEELYPLYAKPDAQSTIIAQLQCGVLGSVKRCNNGWCRIFGDGFDGWIPQEKLWGVYPNESVD
jgi:SH3-like domain-containing protein